MKHRVTDVVAYFNAVQELRTTQNWKLLASVIESRRMGLSSPTGSGTQTQELICSCRNYNIASQRN
jgi:hypothetical protein